MSHELEEGLKLKRVCLFCSGKDGGEYTVKDYPYPFNVKEIEVAMQPGPMGMLPWAKVTMHGGDVTLVNLANVESVTLMPQEET